MPRESNGVIGRVIKEPEIVQVGRIANPLICQELILLLTMKASKLSRTFGPSRKSIRRPEPYLSDAREAIEKSSARVDAYNQK
jgi:hypothetical protein